MRSYLRTGLCVALFSLAQIGNAAETKLPNRFVPEDESLLLLKNERYEAVESRLQSLQNTYKAKSSTENDLHKALYVFYRADPKLRQPLDNWVAKQPKNAMPYLVRGIYRTKMGWTSRGSKWASDTSAQQFSGMAAWFDAAKTDFKKAASLDPSLVHAYCYLIEIDMNEGGRNTKTLFDQALKANSSSFIAREFYLHSQLPRWGGSYESMTKTIEGMRPYYSQAPQLKTLEGRILADVAELTANNQDYKSAIGHFNNALANGDFWFYNQKKGEALVDIQNYQEAIDQFSRVISYKPGYKRAWWMRSYSYKMLGKYAEALADANYVISMESNDDQAIAARAYVFLESGDKASALKDFRSAAILNPANAEYQQIVGQLSTPKRR